MQFARPRVREKVRRLGELKRCLTQDVRKSAAPIKKLRHSILRSGFLSMTYSQVVKHESFLAVRFRSILPLFAIRHYGMQPESRIECLRKVVWFSCLVRVEVSI